jgi:hypothetical protein
LCLIVEPLLVSKKQEEVLPGTRGIEQARDLKLSEETVEKLSRALHLGAAERATCNSWRTFQRRNLEQLIRNR